MNNKITLTKDRAREIIDDFAKEIQGKKGPGPKPSTAVIFFRNERKNNFERVVYEVPIGLLRYRKDNGRIASDVLSYEKDNGFLIESEASTQITLKKFLQDKDPEKTNELMLSIRQSGQLEPAIITADGFLINGNRRKVALEQLYETDNNPSWLRMKVVILPGKDDEGGPPTLKEIEQIENRYQLQSEGKSEYTLFDRALSIRRKIDLDIPLEEQLRDDPRYANMSEREFTKSIIKFTQEFIEPLYAIDTYLDYLGRPEIYSTISTGIGDREGRWQAFLDYSKVRRNLVDQNYRRKNNILLNENELGNIEEIAFKIIRKRQFPGMKVHQIIRNIPKYLTHQCSKDALYQLIDIDFVLPDEESKDKNGNEYSERDKDRIWGEKYSTLIIRQVKLADELFNKRKIKETPVKLMQDALKKLNHEDMKPERVQKEELENAFKVIVNLEKRAGELRRTFFDLLKKK